MPTLFSSFSDGAVVEASHVFEAHTPIQNLEKGAAFYAGTSSGSGTAYAVSLSPAPDDPHPTGMIVNFKVHAESGAGPTLDVNGVGPMPILKNGAQPLEASDLKADQIASVLFDSASGGSFKLLAAAGSADQGLFGDGSDGNVSLSSGTTSLARDMYYNHLTLTGTANIRTNGYRIFVAGVLDLSAAGSAAIRYDGLVASGATGGAARAANTVGGGTAGSNGAAGSVGAGAAASAASALNPANGGNGGGTQASGAGVNAGVNAGVSASAGSTGSNPLDLRVASVHLLRGASLIGAGVGGRGGSSGGGDSTHSGGSGGGGGGAAGVIAVFARTITTSSSTPALVFRAVGGDGAAATAPTAGNCGGGSGGGGGGGGFVYLVYHQRLGPTVSDGIRARGGDGGNGSAATGTGLPGSGGDGGGGGQIIQINLSSQSVSVNTGNRTANPGGAPSGATPGTGGVGRSANGDL